MYAQLISMSDKPMNINERIYVDRVLSSLFAGHQRPDSSAEPRHIVSNIMCMYESRKGANFNPIV